MPTPAPHVFTTGTVTSKDGTTIGYRRIGNGPGLVLLHGGMQSSSSFTTLATALADEFTVYLPDRRGRGMSGAAGPDYGLEREVEDLDALLTATAAHDVFGLSAGALIALHAAASLPSLRRVAVQEPPLVTSAGTREPGRWIARYRSELGRGDLAAAMVTVMKGTGDRFDLFNALPRFVQTRLMQLAIRDSVEKHGADNLSLATLIPAVAFDTQLVEAAAGSPNRFAAIQAELLLLAGSRSASYLRDPLDTLGRVLPTARRVDLPGLGHLAADNIGRPDRVAVELRRFFAPRG